MTFLKSDNYSIMAAYRLAAALCRVVDVHTGEKVQAAGTLDQDEDENLKRRRPPRFDCIVNFVHSKTYEEYNDESLTFPDELVNQRTSASAQNTRGGRPTQ